MSTELVPRKRAIKRMHAAFERCMESTKMFGDDVILIDKSKEQSALSCPDEQVKRRAKVDSAFTALPTALRPFLEIDAEFSMTREGPDDRRPSINCAPVFYDEEKDSWQVRYLTRELYWTLKHDTKLAVLDRWAEDPVLLNEMAQRVNAKLASMEKDAKASFTTAATALDASL